jgi:hypothetical protein
MSSARPTRHAYLAWLALAICIAPPLHAQAAARYLSDLETMESKFTELAEAMESDSYSWSPMDSVRSVSEVYMLIVGENYVIPSAWGAEPPEGMDVGMATFGTMAAVTDKAEVVRHLKESFEYYRKTVASLSDEQLHSTIQFFGRERTVDEALFLIIGDMHEHLGQAIAYARMNQVVPPWTARDQANR